MATTETVHKDIRKRFAVGGRQYEAVGFLNQGEPSVDGDTMLSRTAGENGGAVGDEDEAFLREHASELPEDLRRYYLATGRRSPDDSRRISCLGWGGDRWCQGWGWLGGRWHDGYLVVRRCT